MIGKRCAVIGCDGLVVAKALCQKHYKRVARHGDIDAGRPDDWGRWRSPLNSIWKGVMRYHRHDYPPWQDFSVFAADIGEKPDECKFAKINRGEPFGPQNWFWQKIDKSNYGSDKKAAAREYQKRIRAANPDYFRDKGLQTLYGVSLEWYEQKLAEQGGACAICGKPETAIIRGKALRLSVDHCHDTGKVRGLLCRKCNAGIGHFHHDISFLLKAVEYLKGD